MFANALYPFYFIPHHCLFFILFLFLISDRWIKRRRSLCDFCSMQCRQDGQQIFATQSVLLRVWPRTGLLIYPRAVTKYPSWLKLLSIIGHRHQATGASHTRADQYENSLSSNALFQREWNPHPESDKRTGLRGTSRTPKQQPLPISKSSLLICESFQGRD